MSELKELLGMIQFHLYTLFKNAEILQSHIQSINDNLDTYEFIRLLHNYSMSVASLIDISIRFRDKLKNDTFTEEYQTRINDVMIYSAFLKDLRNYICHWRLPVVIPFFDLEKFESEIDIISEEIATDLIKTAIVPNIFHIISEKFINTKPNNYFLTKKSLVDWNGWSSSSKKLIDTLEELIDVNSIICKYQVLIDQFYQWFWKVSNSLMKMK